MAEPLHLVALHLDLRRLYREAPRARLPLRDLDLDYLVHGALSGLFGEATPGPWWAHGDPGGGLRILAYAERDATALRAIADTGADPELHTACDWERFASKPMTTEFAAGTVLKIEARVCPVVRLAKPRHRFPAGAEVDAWLAACWRVGAEERVEREAVYVGWMRDQLARRGARLTDAALDRFLLQSQYRRGSGAGRPGSVGHRPEAAISGSVVVEDTGAFADAVRSGIGRHRAFGYGMLRLRRA